MIKVAVVDDDPRILESVKICIEGMTDLKEELDIHTFSDAKEFMEKIQPEDVWEIIFSDIQMEGMDGIEFGWRLNERYPHVYLIYLTSFPDYAVDSYQVDAYQYILKQQMDQRIPAVLERLIDKILRERKKFRLIETANELQKIFYQDIVYVQKMKGSKYVEYITLQGIFRERVSLNQVFVELKESGFIMIERGYIVNINFITRLRGNLLSLRNGDQLVVSRAKIGETKEKISKYWRDIR